MKYLSERFGHAVFLSAILSTGGFAAGAADAYGSGSCPRPFRCHVDSDCTVGSCEQGLCAAGTRVEKVALSQDFKGLRLSHLRTTEVTEGGSGSFKVEGLRGTDSVATFEWRFNLKGDVEQWNVRGSFVEADGQRTTEELTFDSEGRRSGRIGNRFFFEFTDWVFKAAGAFAPLWLGGSRVTSGASEITLIYYDDCVTCDFPGCNCIKNITAANHP